MLAERYDALFTDLDGVVYRGDRILPGLPEVLDRVRAAGIPVLFLTNNSSKAPEQVAARLSAMGVSASGQEVLTSAIATAAMLEREGARGQSAFVVGERGVREALERSGIAVVDGEPERADLVVIGWDRTADYAKLRTAALLVQRGARLIATNADASYPAPDGLWPGAGALLAAVTTTTGARATVVGKPSRPLFEAAAMMTGATHPLVAGDRIDTDIAGGAAMGWDTLLVLTGAAAPHDLLSTASLPTYVGRDLSLLLRDPPPGRFRTADPGDSDGVRRLLESAGLETAGLEERLGNTLVCDGVAFDADRKRKREIAATACLDQVDGFGILRSVAVRAELRGDGLGMLAVAAAVRVARDRGIGTIALFTETAAAFFERMGFQKVEWSELPDAIRTSRHAAEECAESATPMLLSLPLVFAPTFTPAPSPTITPSPGPTSSPSTPPNRS